MSTHTEPMDLQAIAEGISNSAPTSTIEGLRFLLLTLENDVIPNAAAYRRGLADEATAVLYEGTAAVIAQMREEIEQNERLMAEQRPEDGWLFHTPTDTDTPTRED